MKNLPYDFAIVGSGPIGASTAYFLSERVGKKKKIALITADPTEEYISTYRYAGGSVRWYWGEEKKTADKQEKIAMTKMTADFALALAKKNIDVSLIEDQYVFATTGVAAPSINISGAKLVDYFIKHAKANGIDYKEKTVLKKITAANDYDGGGYALQTSKGTYRARTVILAVGQATPQFVPKFKMEVEKRVLLVLDVPVSEDQRHFPHLVIPFGKGEVYIFIKKIGDEYKFVLGEEDLIKHPKGTSGKDYLPLLKKQGIAKFFPFLAHAHTEKILWGFDAKRKVPQIYTEDGRLFAVTCGSAVRSCVYIGKMVTERVLKA